MDIFFGSEDKGLSTDLTIGMYNDSEDGTIDKVGELDKFSKGIVEAMFNTDEIMSELLFDDIKLIFNSGNFDELMKSIVVEY
jgi:hypothetical protein